MKFSFKEWLLENNLVSQLGQSIMKGDKLAFKAYLDYLEDRGEEVPEILAQWRNVENINPHVRWLIRRDVPEVLMIEKLSSPQPLNEEDINNYLRKRSCIGQVVENVDPNLIMGYSIHEIQEHVVELKRFLIHPMARNSGVGKHFLNFLQNKLRSYGRETLVANNCTPDMLSFFLKEGFKKTGATSCSFNIGGHEV